jgi:hypothetical protein
MKYLVLALCMSGALMTHPAVADIKGFSVEEDGEGVITKGKLMWMRCALGQTWTGSTCKGEYKKYTWNQAMALRHSYAGHSDWRLPTREELFSIRYCSKGVMKFDDGRSACNTGSQEPSINLKDFPNTPSALFWSASPVAARADYAWGVYFDNGYDYWYVKYGTLSVRLVRGQ